VSGAYRQRSLVKKKPKLNPIHAMKKTPQTDTQRNPGVYVLNPAIALVLPTADTMAAAKTNISNIAVSGEHPLAIDIPHRRLQRMLARRLRFFIDFQSGRAVAIADQIRDRSHISCCQGRKDYQKRTGMAAGGNQSPVPEWQPSGEQSEHDSTQPKGPPPPSVKANRPRQHEGERQKAQHQTQPIRLRGCTKPLGYRSEQHE
jgi:hypothetical protein